MRLQKRKLVTAGVLSAGAIVATATPALADIGPTYSTDSGRGAGGYFYSSGDKLKVCDLKADGLRARGQLYRFTGLPAVETPVGTVDDTSANGECVTKSINVPEGQDVYFRICRYSSAKYAYYNCRDSGHGAA
jgi:hypothetical protein